MIIEDPITPKRAAALHRVSEKKHFCHNFVKFLLTLIILAR